MNIDLIPKQVDLSQSSVKLFEKQFSKSNKQNEKNTLFPQINDRSVQKINYLADSSQKTQEINLKHLEWLLDLENSTNDRNQYHQAFMENYKKIFKQEYVGKDKKYNSDQIWKRLLKQKETESQKFNKNKILAIKNNENSEDSDNQNSSQNYEVDIHNIGLYLEKIHHRTEEIVDPYLKKVESIKQLRRIVKKYPFERKDEENFQIYEILKNFDEFLSVLPPIQRNDKTLLQRLCGYAQLETVSIKSTPVFGNFAFYMILRGSVKPLSIPHLNQFSTKLRPVTPEAPENGQILGVGSCFGTLSHLYGREITTRMFRVITNEDKCEFLKISITNYEKIFKKIYDEERDAKLQTIKNCKGYNSWPKHTIEELMEVFEWKTFLPNTILTSEGYRCPFIGFINKGECHVLRKVDVPFFNKKTGKKEKSMKQVVIGKLKETDTFGEFSVALKEPMTCSIVTETTCKLGIIPFDKISKLDNITLRLLLQTSTRNFADLSQKYIHEKFIDQEKKKEWTDFKNIVVNDVLDKYGIIEGTGKYKTKNVQIESK